MDRGKREMKTVLSFDLVLDTPDTKFAFLAQLKNPSFLFLLNFHCRRLKRPTTLACQPERPCSWYRFNHFRRVGREIPHFRQVNPASFVA
jgi:hypothetical protein